jgi:hypothetical protein
VGGGRGVECLRGVKKVCSHFVNYEYILILKGAEVSENLNDFI